MNKIELEIIAITTSVTQIHSYTVLLGEKGGGRKFPIVIGSFEAQAIAIALEQIHPSRPLTHDLFNNFMTTFDIELAEALIYRLEEGIFYAKLICRKDGELVEIDSRSSDAIALALRMGSPIYTYESIVDKASLADDISMDLNISSDDLDDDDLEEMEDNEVENEYSKMSKEELNQALEQALEKEDYNTAIIIRDELKKR